MSATSSRDLARVLLADEPPAVEVVAHDGSSPFVILCDHAGARVPRQLDALGLSPADLQRHIAWDIGAAGVARKLGELLNCFVILQTYSRLVIDCNRPPGSAESIVRSSERTSIPGNASVSPLEAAAREREIFRPYHDRIGAVLDSRDALNQPTVLICLHSFTPTYLGEQRPWHTGMLYNRDPRLAQALLAELRADACLTVGDNEPYSVADETDYAIPVYGEGRGLLHVGIEIRQDLVADDSTQHDWAQRLAAALQRAVAGLLPR
jgi:predicted N-formylglutamate amidohydrolase